MAAIGSRPRPPFEQVLARLGRTEPEPGLPRRWQRLSHVVVLPHLAPADGRRAEAAEAYARVLGCKTVLVRAGPMQGQGREPQLELVWGEPDTRVETMQHGVRYVVDARRIMFSQGNLEERARMGRVDARDQTVVDLFAGIGYLCLPMLVHAGARRVIACEQRAEAHALLEENARRNGVAEQVDARLGDCRLVAPIGVADRVLMGYLHDTEGFLDVASRALKPEGGTIHFHRREVLEDWPDAVFARVRAGLADAGREARLLDWRIVKSYAPRVVHGVLDVEVGAA